MRIRAVALVLLIATIPCIGAAQTPTITGVVRDSIARVPLGGAMVQLVGDSAAAGRTVTADSLGRFAFSQIANGRYTLGFFHPLLESLGVEPPLHEVFVLDGRPMRVDLGTPSAARLRSVICGKSADSGGVTIGVVRSARDGSPIAGASIVAEWFEMAFQRGAIVRRIPRLVATSAENGWFALCNVPNAGTIALTATRGADTTDIIEMDMPAGGFLRRELFLGARRTITVGDSAPRRVQVGEGRVSGVVTAEVGGWPLANAQVGIVGGPQTRTNERGQFTITDAPLGTRMLEVRALSYYPERRPVDVAAGVPPVKFALMTLRAKLDTVRIRSARLTGRDRNGFIERSRAGSGRFISQEEIAKKKLELSSDLFRNLPGIRLEYDPLALDRRVLMRGDVNDWCEPGYYIDGHYLSNMTAGDLDDWVKPKEIAGIEIYTIATAPAQFQRMDGCGSIVIWTKRS
jgi:hypothetical protein